MTDKEILQGIDRLDAELPFDEICVGGKDNWHDIDVHELLYEVRERIKEWHYPSKGELPPKWGFYLVTLEYSDTRFVTLASWHELEHKWYGFNGDWYNPIAWMPLPEPPKEEA